MSHQFECTHRAGRESWEDNLLPYPTKDEKPSRPRFCRVSPSWDLLPACPSYYRQLNYRLGPNICNQSRLDHNSISKQIMCFWDTHHWPILKNASVENLELHSYGPLFAVAFNVIFVKCMCEYVLFVLWSFITIMVVIIVKLNIMHIKN